MSYPKWLYSKSGGKIIRSHAEEVALEGEWFDSPAKVIPVDVIEPSPDLEEEILEVEKPIGDTALSKETLTLRPKLGRPFKDK